MTDEPIKSDFLEHSNSIKLLLFVEAEPLSDKFEQLMFTQEDMKKIRKFISRDILKENPIPNAQGVHEFILTTNDDVVIHVENAKDAYPEEEIAEAKREFLEDTDGE